MVIALTLSAVLLSQAWDPSQPTPPGDPPPIADFATVQPTPAVPQNVVPQNAAGVAAPEGPVAAAPPSEFVTRQELEAATSKMAWRKGEFTVVPYGTIWGNMAYDSQRSRIGDYALWIESQTTHPHDPAFNVDAKSTRIGLDFTGPGIPALGDAKVGGKVEVDFQGQFVTRNKPSLLLRHAYIEAKSDEFRLLAGQTWDVISPLGIPTLNYTAGSAVGNLAYRRAQFRAERYWGLSDTFLFTLQGSVNGNVVTDFVSDPATTTSADPGEYPDFQARAAITLGPRSGPCAKPIVLGVGGHYGIQSFDFRIEPIELDDHVPSYSLATDWVIPLTDRLGVQGEFFTGFNLSNYMGGILQGVDRFTHRGIHATGGWIDIYFDWTPALHSHTGFAIDDPADRDMTAGRVRNQTLFTNLIWDATKNLQFGLEVDVWETHFIALAPGEATRIEFATKYRF